MHGSQHYTVNSYLTGTQTDISDGPRFDQAK